jgi:hypothetical protein
VHNRRIYASHLDGLWTSRYVALSSATGAFYSVFVHRLARLFNASFRPRLAAVALASSLGLHLHQVGQRTFTSKLLSMPSTQRSRSRGGRCRVYRPKRRSCPLEERMGPEVDDADGCQNCYMVKINNIVLAEVPVWQGFSGRNRLNSHSTPRVRTRERLPSDGCIESELPRSRLTGTVVPFASDTALTSLAH